MKNRKLLKSKFMLELIKALQLKPYEFNKNLENKEVYETFIYNWALTLFQEGKDINQAIGIILKKRIQVIYSINNDSILEDSIVNNRKYLKILSKLQSNPMYSTLKEKEKQGVREKINALVETRLWSISEIIDFAIEIIRNTIVPDDKNDEYKRTFKNKDQSENNSLLFFSEFKNLLTPKTMLNETTLQSS